MLNLILFILFFVNSLAATDMTRTYFYNIRNESDVPWELSRRCESVMKGAGAAQVYYSSSVGEWQPMMTVLKYSEGRIEDPSGLKGVMIKDPYLQGCQLRLRPICASCKKLPTYYIKHGTKASGSCPSSLSFGPYLLETSKNIDFQEMSLGLLEDDLRCDFDIKYARYCGDEEAFIGLIIKKDGTLDFHEGPNSTLIDLNNKSPFKIQRIEEE